MMLAAIRKGRPLTPIVFQDASDTLALRIVDDVLEKGIPEDNAEPLIKDVVDSTKDMSLDPEHWAGSAANSLKKNNFELLNQFVAWYRNLPYRDIGTFEGDVFNEHFGKFVDAAARQNTAAAYSQIYKRPQALDFYLTRGKELQPVPGMDYRPKGENVSFHPDVMRVASMFPPESVLALLTQDKARLDSPALRELFGDTDFADLLPEQKQKWQHYLGVLRGDPRIGAPFGVEVASMDRLRLVNDAGVQTINNKLLTTLTPEEAVKRQQMASVRARRGASLPEPVNPLPVFTLPEPLLTPTPTPVPYDGGREGRAAQPHPALGFDVPTPPTFKSPALPSKEQMGINLTFSPPPSLVAEADGRQRIERPPPPGPDDAPVTLKQLQDSQEALLLDLRVTLMNRPAPEIDILALRRQLRREDYLDVLRGRTIHSYP
ncbi:hypothetical protein [Elstera cyanobacteriorum]|nr:hypothetical protein [Elstera cyanobacteriorum]